MNFLFKHQRKFLLFAALCSFIGGAVPLIAPSFFFKIFFKYQPDLASTFPFLSMYHYIFWSMVFLFGIAYWIYATRPKENRAVLLLGGLFKLVTAAFWIMLFAQGQGQWGMLAGACEAVPFGLIMLLLYFGKETTAASAEIISSAEVVTETVRTRK